MDGGEAGVLAQEHLHEHQRHTYYDQEAGVEDEEGEAAVTEHRQRQQQQAVPVGGQGGGGRRVSRHVGPGRPLLGTKVNILRSEMGALK